jgi:hypothetical protein
MTPIHQTATEPPGHAQIAMVVDNFAKNIPEHARIVHNSDPCQPIQIQKAH